MAMADASRILQTTLIPTFSQNPSHCRTNNLSHYHCSVKRFHRVRCSSLYTAATDSESAAGTTAVTWGCDIDSVQNASALQRWLSDCGLPPQKMAIQKVQVFISCGRKSNGELLLSYGFVPREGTNPRDSVELSLSIKKSDKCYKEKFEALKKQGLSASHCYPLQITGWPVELLAYACLAVSPPSMRSQFDEMAAAASNKTTSKKDTRYPEIEEEALQFILDACEASISKYSKFLQESGTMDLDVTNPKLLNRKAFLKQLAVDLCTREQRILFRAQYILEGD